MGSIGDHWLFANLDVHERELLGRIAVCRHIPDGQTLFSQGGPTPGLHLVNSGAIMVYTLTPEGHERIVDIVGPGEFCGEMGVLDRSPSSAWGRALGSTVVWVIPPDRFERLLVQWPRVCFKVCQVLVRKLRVTSEQLSDTYFRSSRERITRHLVRLAQRHGRMHQGRVRLDFRLTHQELANMVGTGRATVSRVLGELQDRGVLAVCHRQLVITDMDALCRMAQMEETDYHLCP